MAFKIPSILLKNCNGTSIRFGILDLGYAGIHCNLEQRFASSIATRRNGLTANIAWRRPQNQSMACNGNNELPPIKICIAQKEDQDRLSAFMGSSFFPEEPLTNGMEPKEVGPAEEEFLMSQIDHGSTLLATRQTCNEETVVGAVIAGPKDCTDAEDLQKLAEEAGLKCKWGQILALFAKISKDSNVFKRYNVARALHVHALAVHKCARGQSIGVRLMEELMALGKSQNFPLLTVDCSSIYCARLCERLGMECVNVLRYEDHCGEGGKPAFQPPEPHDSIKTFAKKLCD